MSYKLVIVESPSKAKTIEKYLGKDYKVIASKGHIMDLPKKDLGVNIDDDFKLDLIPIEGKEETIKMIKELSQNASVIYLATDPDREGEAISLHIKDILPKEKKTYRVKFNAITKDEINKAIKNPKELDLLMCDSQKTRRVLDRLVGFKISPILCNKISKGLSAGRVQSVALRIIVEREDEIRKFVPEKSFEINLKLKKDSFILDSSFFGYSTLKKYNLKKENEAKDIFENIKNKQLKLTEIKVTKVETKPTAPFTTSKLQQDASRSLKFPTKKTMEIAQKLYEGKNLGEFGTHGLITYMRTDSVRTDDHALVQLRDYIKVKLGDQYLAKDKILYKTKGDGKVQDAHEAIRPTSMEYEPEKIKEYLSDDEFDLYSLIWKKFISSQMTNLVEEKTTYFFNHDKYFFRTTGKVVVFEGFKKVYGVNQNDEDEESSNKLPKVEKDDLLDQSDLPKFVEKFSSPPPRFTEAGLVKELEEKGIGRPSTYAAIITNITERKYVEKTDERFVPTEIGDVLCKVLIKAFAEQMDVKFTANVENELDDIESGQKKWKDVLKIFWESISKNINQSNEKIPNFIPRGLPTGVKCEKCVSGQMLFVWKKTVTMCQCDSCPNSYKAKKVGNEFIKEQLKEGEMLCGKCGGLMILKEGSFGKFYACSSYPNCKNTLPAEAGIPCPICGVGKLFKRKTKNGAEFYGCSSYPNCNYAVWNEPIEQKCIHCFHKLLEKYKDGKIKCAKCKKEQKF